MGLDAPKAAQIAARLRSLGLSLEQGIYTIEQLRTSLNKLKNGGDTDA